MFTDLPILSNKDCKQWYQDLNTPFSEFTSTQVSQCKICIRVIHNIIKLLLCSCSKCTYHPLHASSLKFYGTVDVIEN